MRLILLATLIVLGICLAYAHRVNPEEAVTMSYRGPATFVSLTSDCNEDAPCRWLLVCRVRGDRVAFHADTEWARGLVGEMRPGQAINLSYDLPATATPLGTELGPPTLRTIRPASAPIAVALSGE
jgi:hypothetical protein